MELLYLVAYTRHNVKTGGTAYKVDYATPDIDMAKRKYHSLFGEFVGSEDFDFVSVIIYDSLGNLIKSEYWDRATVAE